MDYPEGERFVEAISAQRTETAYRSPDIAAATIERAATRSFEKHRGVPIESTIWWR